MRYVQLTKAEPGMILAYDIFDSHGRTLAGHNVILTEGYIERLKSYGFDGVYIQDELSEDIEVESAIPSALRTEGIACIKNNNIDGCKNIAKKIVDEILSKDQLSLDMTDLRSYDDYTYAHSVNVAVLSCVIGTGMKLNEEEMEYLVTAAVLHDFGKLTIPQEILNKPSRLTQEEFQIMQSHAMRSYEMICDRTDLSAYVKSAVLCHHENVDGSGYPLGIEGSEQTLFTKILHVADVYDALIAKRPYKEPYSPYEATEYLMGGCGIMFDQAVVTTLLNYVPLYPKGTEVVLSDGRRAVIYENAGIYNLRPILKLYDHTMLDLTAPENLNLTIRDAREQENLEEQEQERKQMIKPLRRYRIMAIDDMKPNLLLLQDILKDYYDVILLRSGTQAIHYMEKYSPPDLIIMDIDMPDMDGLETAKRIQEMTNQRVPILFVTVLCDKVTVTRCRELNAAGYILRPYKPAYIKTEIKRILENWMDV
ncbi:MAG: response regulator [Lachnospiraceae bacterium]|nr:response regulator [Lachnospiraceae bacterium]